MALQQETEASNVCESLQSLIIARGRLGMSGWYTSNAEGSLGMERQRGEACLPKLEQLLVGAEQWSGSDPDFVARVQALKTRLEDLIAAAL